MLKTKRKTVPLEEIKITEQFAKTRPDPIRLVQKTEDFLYHKNLPAIVLDREYTLVDGYMSYLILKALGFDCAVCKICWEVLTRKERREIAKQVLEEVKDEFIEQDAT